MESSFQIAICECPDINANTMAVDGTGRYALISGRKSMVLVDLDGGNHSSSSLGSNSLLQSNLEIGESPKQMLSSSSSSPLPKNAPISKKMVRNSKYEPTASQFNRHMVDLFALTNHQNAEIFSIEDLNPSKPKLILRGHSRAITDVEWSYFDPYLVGSSAADCLTNLWDIRDSRRPSATLTSVSAATQVRFSKTSSNLIATSHEIDVRIWDIRQPNLPLYYIAAHLQKINGMDWNPNKTSSDHEQLITCSQDNIIKLWDLQGNKIKPSASLPTRTPAWRVRYNPVSFNAILTSTLPQLRSRTECMALKLWSLKPSRYEQKKLQLIMGLVGHTDVIVDFHWKNRPTSAGSEIVSWSKDQTLRVWRIDQQFIEMNVDNSDSECEVADTTCESIPATASFLSTTSEQNQSQQEQQHLNSNVNICDTPMIRQNQKQSLLSDINVESASSKQFNLTDQEHDNPTIACDRNIEELSNENLSPSNELRLEFNLLNKNIPNIEFEELNSLRRVCLVTARAKGISCRLKIALPLGYPHSECPTFTILESNQYGREVLTKEAKEKLLLILNETAKSQLSGSRNCLEPCLRKFIAALQKITTSSSYRNQSKRSVGISATGQEYKDDPITLSAQRDHSIPFPNTCGVRFCGNLLVCFGRPIIPSSSSRGASGDVGAGGSSSGESANWSVETPRSMAQLSAQLDNMRRQGSYNLNHISISYFYYGAMRKAELQNRMAKSSSASGSRSGGSSRYLQGKSKSSLHNQSMMSKSYKCGPVLVYDVSDLLGGISRELAENYVFDKDVIKMCRRNAEIAARYNRRDLVQIWSLAELSSEGVLHSYVPNKSNDRALSFIAQDSDFGDRPWTMHPFGSKLIQSLIDHYVNNCHDVQTAAMLVWTFSSPKLGINSMRSQNNSKSLNNNTTITNKNNPLQYSITSNYNTVIPGMLSTITYSSSNKQPSNNQIDAISDEWNFVNGPETHLYSNSWSNSAIHEHLSDSHSNNELTRYQQGKSSAGTDMIDGCSNNYIDNYQNDDEKFPKLNILSPERSLQNDLIMHIYAEVLYRLNLLNQRAMVLKNVGSNSLYNDIFGNRQTSNEVLEERLSNLTIQCYNGSCRNKCRSAQCPSCKKYSLYCSICRLPVKGSCSICLKCLHSGHVNHFNTWFNSYDFCPTGCGCKCLLSTE